MTFRKNVIMRLRWANRKQNGSHFRAHDGLVVPLEVKLDCGQPLPTIRPSSIPCSQPWSSACTSLAYAPHTSTRGVW
jgi:hypothetical protein